MPSCAVKCCKNYSKTRKNNLRVTFHRFPTISEPWKTNWINIIRACRREKNWTPTKSSVVCSVHFDANFIYKTPKGCFRIMKYAVPNKFLYEPPSEGDVKTFDEQHEALETSSVTGVVDTIFEPQLPFMKSSPPSSPLPQLQTSSVNGEKAAGDEESSPPLKCSPPCSPSQVPQTSSVAEVVTMNFEPSVPLIEYCSSETSLELQSLPIKVQYQLMKKENYIKKLKTKVKTLNQNVRRLQDRNKSLKSILKSLRNHIINT